MSDLSPISPSSSPAISPATFYDRAPQPVEVSFEEVLRLSSQDMAFYGQHFFPRTCRQDTPPFHLSMYRDVQDPLAEFIAWMIFRGGAKTSITRIIASFLIAFGFSRTICVVGKSEAQAVSSVEWLLKAAKFNALWRDTFHIGIGKRESQNHIELIHGIEQVSIRVLALGMEGSLRGVNFDDYRPDLILVDDPCDEENVGTAAQRKKTAALFFGALQQSLAPASEAPMRKMVLSQTVLNSEDLISLCCKSPDWRSSIFSCFDANGESRWPQRWTTHELLKEKQSYIDKNQLSIWLREKECKIVSDETAAFPWPLKYWDVIPEGGITVLSVDPTPPPREGAIGQIVRKSGDLDKATVTVLRLFRNAVFVCETYGTQSPDEEELFSKMAEMAHRWAPIMHIAIETILFARVIASGFKKWLARKRLWMTIKQIEDRRKKETRIRSEIAHFASNGLLYVHRSQMELIEQYTSYPDVNHDDFLDGLAVGLMSLNTWRTDDKGVVLEGDFLDVTDVKPLNWARCP